MDGVIQEVGSRCRLAFLDCMAIELSGIALFDVDELITRQDRSDIDPMSKELESDRTIYVPVICGDDGHTVADVV